VMLCSLSGTSFRVGMLAAVCRWWQKVPLK